jgi:hypothetical protein
MQNNASLRLSEGHGCGPWTADVFFMLDSRLVIEI